MQILKNASIAVISASLVLGMAQAQAASDTATTAADTVIEAGHGGGGGGGGHAGGGGGGGGHIGGGNPNPGNGGGHIGGGNPNPGNGGGHIGGGNPNPGNGGGHIGGGNPNPGNGGGHIGGGNPNPGNGGGHIGGGNPNPGNGGGHIGGGNPNPGNGGGHIGGGNPNPGNGGGHVGGGNFGPDHGFPGQGGQHFPGGNPMVHNGNVMSPGQIGHINQAGGRMQNVMQRDPHVMGIVGREGGVWQNQFRPIAYERFGVYQRFYGAYNPYYTRYWYPYGFYGFGWEINPYYNINEYYYNPLIYWFYCDNWDEGFYQTWYGPNYATFASYPGQFYRRGVFFPTVAFRDLVLGASDWQIERQNIFRHRMQEFSAQLELRVSQRVGNAIQLDANAIVVSHNQVLDDRAIVMDGFVTYNDNVQMPFKALLDLSGQSEDKVFIPASNADQPAAADVQELQQLNAQITTLGGVVDAPTAENQAQAPAPVTAPTTAPTSEFGGEVVLVFNTANGAYGVYHGAATRADAETAALAACGAGCNGVTAAQLEGAAGNTVHETWAHNGWVALATDGKGHWGAAGVHDSQSDSEAAALANCNHGQDNGCYVLRSQSSFDNQPDQDGTDPTPAQN